MFKDARESFLKTMTFDVSIPVTAGTLVPASVSTGDTAIIGNATVKVKPGPINFKIEADGPPIAVFADQLMDGKARSLLGKTNKDRFLGQEPGSVVFDGFKLDNELIPAPPDAPDKDGRQWAKWELGRKSVAYEFTALDTASDLFVRDDGQEPADLSALYPGGDEPSTVRARCHVDIFATAMGTKSEKLDTYIDPPEDKPMQVVDVV